MLGPAAHEQAESKQISPFPLKLELGFKAGKLGMSCVCLWLWGQDATLHSQISTKPSKFRDERVQVWPQDQGL